MTTTVTLGNIVAETTDAALAIVPAATIAVFVSSAIVIGMAIWFIRRVVKAGR
jgi:hypothetical protein